MLRRTERKTAVAGEIIITVYLITHNHRIPLKNERKTAVTYISNPILNS